MIDLSQFNGLRYHSANTYFQSRFGCKTYKLALDGGMTCPNRDGTVGTGGCIFCSSSGSGEFAEKPCDSIEEQLARAKRRVANKVGDAPRYIAYFQSYTNTYAPAVYLRQLYLSAIAPEDIVALSIATRPDCLPPEVLDLLGEINAIKPVFVELGLQTCRDDTAELIHRGYPTRVYMAAVDALRAKGIHVITHIIFGLPGESAEDMLATVKYAVNAGTNGLKLQLLQVLQGTALAELWREGKVKTLSKETYIDLVCDALRYIPPQVVIHRLTGDPPRALLLAPSWATDKKGVLNALNKRMRERNIVQGHL